MATVDEEREQLESERDFLLRSLDDLEAERAAGNIDDESYARLHDDYTARAAAVIRALRDGVDARPAAAPLPASRKLLVGGAIAAFAVVAAIALAAALGARLPGQQATGNQQTSGDVDQRGAALEAAVEQSPDDVDARLDYALFLAESGDLAGALRQWDEAIRIDPANVEALSQSGRALYLTAQQVAGTPEAAELVNAARDRLDRAVAANPEYPEARFFRAVLLAQELLDRDQAIGDAQRYLVLAPDGPYSEQALQLLEDLDAPLPEASTVPSTTT
jgi:cytochrome c-type biogenesis protein CcmH